MIAAQTQVDYARQRRLGFERMAQPMAVMGYKVGYGRNRICQKWYFRQSVIATIRQ